LNQTAPLFLPQELDQNQCIHGRPQKFFQGCGQRRNFAYPFQVTNGAMQMDVHKTIYPIYPISLWCWLNLNRQSLF